ncbi:MAG: TonB-dependent receptor [Phycisphaerales bacterium]|nr:TonB-dependent receptor [Hyphomonadaceae bacterium]
MSFRSNRAWLLGVASAAFAFTGAAKAQDASDADTAVTQSEDIVVLGEIQYRNRVEGAAPVLEYGAEYFQRFEPLTVGDALKRVPSVAFLSDVLESDGVRLRGLDPAYTQILINGEQVPGAGDSSGAFGNGADGAFFVDRIPAELIERVEIVRSQSANRSGDALAGAINIVLRDSYSLDGGYIRAGVLNWANDDHWGQTIGGVWGGEVGGGRLLVGANMQDRHNPKDKVSLRFDEPGDPINNSEVQTDVRDGTDYSANFSYDIEALGGELSFDGFIVHTDRTQTEDSIEYSDGIVDDANIETLNANDVDIEQRSFSLNGRYTFESFGGENRIGLGFAQFTNEAFEFEDEASFDPFPVLEEYGSEIGDTELTDEEWRLKLEHERELGGGLELEFGVHFEQKERENLVRAADVGFEAGDPGFPPPTDFDGSLVDPADLDAVDGGDNTIERRRIDPYVMLTGEAGAIEWEAGLRYETTEITVEDRTTGTSDETSYEVVLPSAHVSWNLTENDRVLLSAARTVRSPSFSFLSPALLEEELGDSDFQGVPTLDPETAWGIDIGYERRLGRTGIVGVNYFYRDVSDLIEIFNTGVEGSEGPGTFVYSARNTGDGKVWGVEFDLSTSLSALGLENTGVFFNYSWLDSEVEDEIGTRRFNSQAESIFNIGFIQDLPRINSSFGVTYRDQGSAFSRVVAEEVTTEYGADLEFFVEHRFGSNFTVRLTGSNLLDESKDEVFDKFDNLADQIARDYDEYELESESAGPVFQLVGRYAF